MYCIHLTMLQVLISSEYTENEMNGYLEIYGEGKYRDFIFNLLECYYPEKLIKTLRLLESENYN